MINSIIKLAIVCASALLYGCAEDNVPSGGTCELKQTTGSLVNFRCSSGGLEATCEEIGAVDLVDTEVYWHGGTSCLDLGYTVKDTDLSSSQILIYRSPNGDYVAGDTGYFANPLLFETDNTDTSSVSLEGTWNLVSIENSEAVDASNSVLVFNADATYDWFLLLGIYSSQGAGAYSLADNQLTIDGILTETVNELSANPNLLVLSFSGNDSLSFVDDEGDRWVYERSQEVLSNDGSALLSATGSWTSSGGQDQDADNILFNFTVTQAATVTISLNSADIDTYLILRNDADNLIESNDDGDGVDTNSLISVWLEPGTYTIVAATYYNGETGVFTLTVEGMVSDLVVSDFVVTEPQLDNFVGGQVVALGTAEPLAGVKVKIPLEGADYVTYSDSAGNYSLPAEFAGLPDSFAIVFSLAGYIPHAENITTNSNSSFTLDVQLEAESIQVVVMEIEPFLHHLGDDTFSGSANSQFQMAAEGVFYTVSFELTAQQLAFNSAQISMIAKGVQNINPLKLNANFIDNLDVSPADGSFAEMTVSFSPGVLAVGTNTLRIDSIDGGNSYDDFEFTNIILRLN